MRRRAPEFLVLAMDIGSSSTRTALFGDEGQARTETGASREYSVGYGKNGAAELPAAELYRAGELCLRRTLKVWRDSSSLRRAPIVAVGASAFWHSLLGLNRNGAPITPVYT